jgi:valyl-tRNA synthetase
MIDVGAERKRLDAEIGEIQAEVARAEGMLANEQFVQRAPEHVVDGHRQRLTAARERLELLLTRRAAVG